MLTGNSEYRRGKAARLANKPEPVQPPAGQHSQAACDYISGWYVADCNRSEHPDWSDEYILA